MSSRTPALENLPVLEAYRHGIVQRWNEMMSVIDDSKAFNIRLRMMIAELKDLATDKEREFLEMSVQHIVQKKKYTHDENREKSAVADKLNVLSEIFRSRVISPRWILPFDSESRAGFGQVSSTVQQNLQSNFFKLDHRSLFEVFFFVRQVELLLHNLENPEVVHEDVTKGISKWLVKWGFRPYGVPKKMEFLAYQTRSGRKSERMKELEDRLASNPDADDVQEIFLFNPAEDNVKEFEEKHNIDPTRPNYVNLINYDHLKLLKYRNRTDYSQALMELLNVLKVEMKFLQEKGINLLTTYIPFNEAQVVS